jgi:NPCBM/NEW2 domain
MPHRCFAALLLCMLAADLQADERYVAWLADGTRLTAGALPAWPLPDSPFRFANQDLLATSNPVRLVQDRQQASALKAPYITLANGDVLPGMPVQLEPEQGRLTQIPRLRVIPEPPLLPVTGIGVAVRTDRVLRIVLSSAAASLAPPQGTVVLANGRRLLARAIRWHENGLAILTADDVVEAAYTELADVVFPNVEIAEAVLEDNWWAGGESGVAIARFQATNGAIVTAARASREQEPDRRRGRVSNASAYYLQPAWADQPLAIPEQEIVCCGYRAADEAPLAAFGATALSNRRLIGSPAPWSVNCAADGGMLAGRDRQSDTGFAAHAQSQIAIDLPREARSLELAVGMDQTVGDGGCVRCKVVGEAVEGHHVLWDSGVLQGKDGVRNTGRLTVAGLTRVQLVTEFAHEDRPAGADPLDIRDCVVWLSPLVRMDLSAGGTATRAQAVLPGAVAWDLAGNDWMSWQLASRWNVPASNWDTVIVLPKQAEMILKRRLTVTRASDVVELLTVCPVDLDEHDFALRVNGEAVPWSNNGDRNQLRQWTLRYSRTRARDGDQEANLTDRLAYWWDLSQWRGQEVMLELVLRGKKERNEIAWRGLAIRSAIGNLPEEGEPLVPAVTLASQQPLEKSERARGQIANEPVRLLGQEFRDGYVLARNSRVEFSLRPEFQKFVAIVGCTAQVAGPVQVLIDGRVVWERAAIHSLAPAEQIEIAIPRGAKTMTLQSGAEGLYYGAAAFAAAGFTR